MGTIIEILFIVLLSALGLYIWYGDQVWEKIKQWFSDAHKTTIDTSKTVGKAKTSLLSRIAALRFGKKTKSTIGQKLTHWELNFLWYHIIHRSRVRCINCEAEDMYEGAQGGMSTNWHCPKCGQGISLTIIKASKDGILCDNIGIDTSHIINNGN